MVDPLKYSYYLVLVTEKKKKYDITNFVEDLGWEELENELAAKLSCTVKNDKTTKGRLSSLTKPGCYLYLYYRYKTGTAHEAMRGRIVEWNPSAKLSSQPLQLKAYDNLYDLQESEDCVYYSSGARTKQVIQDFFEKWGITINKYTGPNVTHGVIKEDKKKLGTLVKDILDEAKKKGGGYSVIRSVKGKAQILGIGSNSNIYHFGETENMISVSHKISTSGMVTRVKILGEADDDKRRPVEATVDGQTKYGIRQKIITRAKDDSLDEAKKTAKETLEDDGKPKEEIKVVTVDMPVIRKGDIVHIKMSTGSGYYWVKAITHDCDKMETTISLKKTKLKSSSSSSSGNKKKTGNFSVGDTVNFHGGTHYVSSDASSGYQVAAGKAKITHSNPGSAHPWCLEGLDWSETHLCGWVDEGTFD